MTVYEHHHDVEWGVCIGTELPELPVPCNYVRLDPAYCLFKKVGDEWVYIHEGPYDPNAVCKY